MRTAFMIGAAALAAFLLSPTATVSEGNPQRVAHIVKDIGGNIGVFDRRHLGWSRENRLIIVDGYCGSSCTRMLFPVYRLNICATPRAVFGFHMPYNLDHETGEAMRSPEQVALSQKWWRDDWMANYPPGLTLRLAKTKVPSPAAGENGMVEIKGVALVKVCPATTTKLTSGPHVVKVVNQTGLQP